MDGLFFWLCNKFDLVTPIFRSHRGGPVKTAGEAVLQALGKQLAKAALSGDLSVMTVTCDSVLSRTAPQATWLPDIEMWPV